MTLGNDYFESFNTPSQKPQGGKKEFVKKDISGNGRIAVIKEVKFDTYNDVDRVSFKLFFPEFNQVEFDNVALSVAAAPVLASKLEAAGYTDRFTSEATLRAALLGLEGGKLEVNVRKQEDSKYYRFYWQRFTPAQAVDSNESILDDDSLPF